MGHDSNGSGRCGKLVLGTRKVCSTHRLPETLNESNCNVHRGEVISPLSNVVALEADHAWWFVIPCRIMVHRGVSSNFWANSRLLTSHGPIDLFQSSFSSQNMLGL